MAIPAYRIVIDFVSEGEVANLIKGFVEIGGKKVKFSGVAYGRFGGQNFSPQFTPSARKSISTVVDDFEKFEEDMQLRLVRGEFDAEPKPGEQHRHQHMGT
ncbi:MAG: hypothetical protein HY296_03870 [Thaumarchaeota archaeon]|nr:hypothetical protein [Nitrososphaerota archaeon]